MQTFVIALLLGIIVGAGGVWYFVGVAPSPAVVDAERRASAQAGKALESAQEAAERAKHAMGAKLEALELRAEDVKKDLAESGKVVRRSVRDRGDAMPDAAADERITAAINAKLAADPQLSALGVSVSTTAGRVTLSGRGASPELIGRVTIIALGTEGVREVVSTLEAK